MNRCYGGSNSIKTFMSCKVSALLISGYSYIIFMVTCVEIYVTTRSSIHLITVAEKDTAVAAKAAVGRPKAAVGRQRAAHRLRLAAAAQPCPPICLKIDSLAYNWLTRLSCTHAKA